MRTLRVGDAVGVMVDAVVAVGVGVDVAAGVSVSVAGAGGISNGVTVGVGTSCAKANAMVANSKSPLLLKIGNRQFAILILLNVIAPIHVRENIIAPFAILQKDLIDLVGRELIVQTVESAQMFQRSLRRIFPGGAGFHEERPIA